MVIKLSTQSSQLCDWLQKDDEESLDPFDPFGEVSKYTNIRKELRELSAGVRGQNKVSALAKDLACKFRGDLPPEEIKQVTFHLSPCGLFSLIFRNVAQSNL